MGVAEVTEFEEETNDDETEESTRNPLEADEIPEWAQNAIPANVKIPKGRKVWYLRLRAAWTHAPDKGDRVIVLWTISDAEENAAAELASNMSQARFIKELAKRMIRAVDGQRANWGGSTKDGIDARAAWEEFGPKGRQQIVNLYMKTHRLTGEEGMDFLSNCVVCVSAVDG